MSSNFMKPTGMLAVAVGAGVVIGAVGVFLYEHVIKGKRRLILQQDVMNLGMSVSELRRELEQMREDQMNHRRAIRNRQDTNVTSSVSELENDMMSVIDDGEDEFFDFSDVGEDAMPSRVDWSDVSEVRPYRDIDVKLSMKDCESKLIAYDELKELLASTPDDSEVLWRLAKACHGIGAIKGVAGDLDTKKIYIHEAIEYATRCLEIAPRSADSHKWYAICIGSRGEFEPIKNKLKDGFLFKEHIEEALKINPDDPTLLHLLGRFRFEVASLSWMERKVASTIFGEVPYSTFPEAIESLKRAEELNKTPWKENRLLLAKCFIHTGNYDSAVYWLDKTFEVVPEGLDETQMHHETERLLAKYERHRQK